MMPDVRIYVIHVSNILCHEGNYFLRVDKAFHVTKNLSQFFFCYTESTIFSVETKFWSRIWYVYVYFIGTSRLLTSQCSDMNIEGIPKRWDTNSPFPITRPPKKHNYLNLLFYKITCKKYEDTLLKFLKY
jgi:hypothetical protein